MSGPLTGRWHNMNLHPTQQAYWNSPHRFNLVPAGRRSGKTELAKRKLVMRALRGTRFENPRFFAAAPVRQQAKDIFWFDFKRLIPRRFITEVSETDLVIRLINSAELHVEGLDKPERIEGSPWDWGVVDEIANCKPEAWPANIRPALTDRNGGADLIGVPEGRNHYYQLSIDAEAQMKSLGEKSDWALYHWTSEEVLPLFGKESEIAAAKRDLDELTYEQEYRASFISFEGRAYYCFDIHEHTAPLIYDADQPLAFCFDFNVAPGCAVVAQEQRLPNGIVGTGVIGEVFIPRNSNTPAVCRRLITDWGKHRGRVICYGDATGGRGGTAQTEGSDWVLIAQHLRPVFGDRLYFDLPRSNPYERDRVNAVNTRLKSRAGMIRVMVDPQRAPMTVRDLDGVRLLKGGSGEIDKRIDPMLTHLSDALGYRIHAEWPVKAVPVIVDREVAL